MSEEAQLKIAIYKNKGKKLVYSKARNVEVNVEKRDAPLIPLLIIIMGCSQMIGGKYR